MGRILVAIMLGITAAFACIAVAHCAAGGLPYVPGNSLTATSPGAALEAHSIGGKAIIVLGWCVGTFVGAAVAARMGHREIDVWIVAAIVVASALAWVATVPHGTKLMLAALILPWLSAWPATRLAHRWRPR